MFICLRLALLIFAFGVALTSQAQFIDDVKLGIGREFLGTGDITLNKIEGEVTHKWNRLLSGSTALGAGYRDFQPISTLVSRRTITFQLDENIFFSPFGNDKVYNLKIGTGLSLLYVRERYQEVLASRDTNQRLRLGGAMIIDQEVLINEQVIIGLKAMIQPYLAGDIANSLVLRIGAPLR